MPCVFEHAQFNLDIEEVQFVRDAMMAWREDVHLPLTISIYLDDDSDRRLLLEQWSVLYAPDSAEMYDPYSGARRNANSHLTGAARDVIQQLKEVCKKISVLLRALYSFMRLLPAHRLSKRSYPSTLSYEIHPASSASLENHFEKEIPVSQYSFAPINTPFGFLKISTVYRLNCELIREQETAPAPIFKHNFIIQDYVPSSPELLAQRGDRMSMPAMSPQSTDFLQDAAEPDEFHQRRRRSSPAQVVDESATIHRTPGLSQPMAIPQTKAPTVYEESVASPRDSVKVIHPHSYAEPDRLRGVVTNPNVTAAPYGYGNVAIDRVGTPPATQWNANSSGGVDGAGGNGLSPASYQDEGSQFPLSTPPRHPNSLSILRNSRTFSSSTGSRKGGSDVHQFRSSLENFSLDDGSHNHVPLSPSPSAGSHSGRTLGGRAATFSYGTRRKHSFNGAFTADDNDESGGINGDGAPGTSPHLTPPFMYADSPPVDSPSSTAALVLRRAATDSGASGGRGVPVFASSPPFQANPSELLSTSPGYSYSKNYLRKGPSSLPMFVTTDQFQVGRSGTFRLNAGAPESLKTAGTPPRDQKSNRITQARGFSSDLYESGAAVWGVSPDTPDAFDLAVTGPSSGHRHRFLSSTGSAGGSGGASASSHFEPDDVSDLLLPFAIGDGTTMSAATTLTSTGSELGRPSGAESAASDGYGSKGASWDTASVGSFLNQLKHAPRLHMFHERASPAASTRAVGEEQQMTGDEEREPRSSEQPSRAAVPQSFFEDELANFRSLRDELARDL